MSWLITRLGAYLWPAVGIAFAALFTAFGVQTMRVRSAQAETAKVQQRYDADRAQATQAALAQTTAYRAEEQRRAVAHKGITDAADKQLAEANEAANGASLAAERLRIRVASLIAATSKASGNSVAPGPSAPAAGSGLLLTNLFSSIDERAGQLAKYADEARIAGQACERAYSELTP